MKVETAATVLSRDLLVVREVLLEALGDNVVCLALGGGFGRGEGCVVERGGEMVPMNDLDIYPIVRRPLSRACVLELEQELVDRTWTGAVDLLPRLEAELPRLSPTIENWDLRDGHLVFWGDGAILERIPAYDAAALPPWEGENLLRNRLVTILQGAPDSGDIDRCLYQSAKGILAAVDAYLVREGRHATSYRDNVEAFRSLPGVCVARVVPLVDQALRVKLDLTPPDRSPEEFWHAALGFYLDALVDFLCIRGVDRPARLHRLLGCFHYRSTSRLRTLKKCVRIFLGVNEWFDLDRLLLGLCIDADGCPVDLEALARKCGLDREVKDGLLPAAVRHWYELRKGPVS